jgi:hypothetical protein
MGASLGAFGSDPDGTVEASTFTFHGETFEVAARISALPIMRFAHETRVSQAESRRAGRDRDKALTEHGRSEAMARASEAEMAMLSAMHVFLRNTIGPDQWERFEAVAVQYGDPPEEILAICQAIYASVIDRPTSRPPDSSGGPSTSGTGSTGDSVSPEPAPGPTTSAVPRPDRAAINGLLVPVGSTPSTG